MNGGATGTGGSASGGATGTGGGATGAGGAAGRRRNGDRWQRERWRDGNGRRGDGGHRWRGSGQIGRFRVVARAPAGSRAAGARRARAARAEGASGALCPPSALVCEDFEDGKADGWSALVSGMTINGTHAASGTKALSLNIPANQRGGFISYKGAP